MVERISGNTLYMPFAGGIEGVFAQDYFAPHRPEKAALVAAHMQTQLVTTVVQHMDANHKKQKAEDELRLEAARKKQVIQASEEAAAEHFQMQREINARRISEVSV